MVVCLFCRDAVERARWWDAETNQSGPAAAARDQRSSPAPGHHCWQGTVCCSWCCYCYYRNTGWPQTWKTWNSQGFLWTWKTQGILREFCATSGKNCNKQSIFSSSFKYLCKTAVDWVNGIIRNRRDQSVVVTCYIAGVDVEWPLMKFIITFTFCCNNLWKSKFMALEKPGKLRES